MAMNLHKYRLIYLLSIMFAIGCEHKLSSPTSQPTSSELQSFPSLNAKSDRNSLAPDWLLSLDDVGQWADSTDESLTHVWIDCRVANLEWHKYLSIELLSTYANGEEIRILAPMEYKGKIGTNDRWGTDALEIYSRTLSSGEQSQPDVRFRVRLQMGLGDQAGLWHSHWFSLEGDQQEVLPGQDLIWPQSFDSPVITQVDEVDTEVLFAPFNDPGAKIISKINELIKYKSNHPFERVTLHAAVFNMNDADLIATIIKAHQAGVEVRLIMDGRKFRPRYTWYQGDELLLAAQVPLLGIHRMDDGAMHQKFILFNGESLATGSMNWELGARINNHENVIFTSEPDLVKAYAQRFEFLAGGMKKPRRSAHHLDQDLSVSFAPDEPSHIYMSRLIEQAQDQILIAMFTAKDVWWTEGQQKTSLLTKLVESSQRGVEVIMILDHDIHEASEYYGSLSDDDPVDEWLLEQGIRVILADNKRSRYASMHHKFIVIDQQITVTGAYNWYFDSAYKNDEDQVVFRDSRIAAEYTGEFITLLSEYDSENFTASAWPQSELTMKVYYDQSQYGDSLLVSGSDLLLGQWVTDQALLLNDDQWPMWTIKLSLPQGLRTEYKIVKETNGMFHWEEGINRRLKVSVDNDQMSMTLYPTF